MLPPDPSYDQFTISIIHENKCDQFNGLQSAIKAKFISLNDDGVKYETCSERGFTKVSDRMPPVFTNADDKLHRFN